MVIHLLKENVSKLRFIKLKFSDYRFSFLEYLLSRANRRISPLIKELFLKVTEKNANYLELTLWRDLSKKHNLELEYFLELETPLRHLIRNGEKICS